MPEAIQEQPKEKLKLEFFHTDELGQPILDPRTGKQGFTNLTADTPEEMNEKLKEAYINVNRALARARNHRPVPKEPEPVRKELSAEEQRVAVAELQDPLKAPAAIRKLAGVEDLENEVKKAREKQANADALAAQYKFMSAHRNDFYPCQANSKIMWDEIKAQGLDPTVAENYEIAFNAVQNKLAQEPAPPKVEEPPKEEPRRQAAGGIQPGELSGARPIQRKAEGIRTKDGLLTVEKLKEMRKTAEGRAEYNRRLKHDPLFGPAVEALLAKR